MPTSSYYDGQYTLILDPTRRCRSLFMRYLSESFVNHMIVNDSHSRQIAEVS